MFFLLFLPLQGLYCGLGDADTDGVVEVEVEVEGGLSGESEVSPFLGERGVFGWRGSGRFAHFPLSQRRRREFTCI